GGGLAAGVGELDRDLRAPVLAEPRDAVPGGGLGVVPQSGVLGTDPALGRDGGRLGDHQPETAGGARPGAPDASPWGRRPAPRPCTGTSGPTRCGCGARALADVPGPGVRGRRRDRGPWSPTVAARTRHQPACSIGTGCGD